MMSIEKAVKELNREELELVASNLFHQCALYHKLLMDAEERLKS